MNLERKSAEEGRDWIVQHFKKSEVEIPQQKLKLVDNFTLRKLGIPIRGLKCDHIDCLDLESLLQRIKPKPKSNVVYNKAQWNCTICYKKCKSNHQQAEPDYRGSIYIDEYILEVVR